MSQTPNEPERPDEPGAGQSPLSWGQQQPGAAPPPEQPQWGAQPYPSAPPPPGPAPYPVAPTPGAQPQPGQPEWGAQPQWGAQPPPAGGQWGAQPQWGGQPTTPGWAPVPPGASPWSAKPPNGIIPLRPLALGELYDGAVQAIRSNPRTMIGVSAVVVLIVTLIGAIPQAASLQALGSLMVNLEDPDSITPEQIAGTAVGSFAGLLIPQFLTAIAITVLSGMLMVAVSAAVLGRRTPLAALWAQVRSRILALVGLSLVTSIVPAIAFTGCLVPGLLVLASGEAEAAGVILLVLGVPIGLVLCAWLWVKWSLAAPALLLENQGVGGALGRSWFLARRTFWRLFLILLLTVLLVGVFSSIVGAPFGAIAAVLQPEVDNPLAVYSSFTDNLVRTLITGIGQIIAGAVLYPFSAAVTALLYVDVRMRREGLDVELMRAVSGQS